VKDDSLNVPFGENESLHYMRAISGGEFLMGTGQQEHKVLLTSAFYLGVYPVTQQLWTAVKGTNPSAVKNPNHPVEMVSWLDAIVFCNQLSRLHGFSEVYELPKNLEEIVKRQVAPYDEHLNKVALQVTQNKSNDGYRLPTEAEWTYSAKANTNLKYSGGNDLPSVAWFKHNSNGTSQPVGKFHCNKFGLYDMSGNVHEWCWDWEASFQNWDKTDPTGPSRGTQRMLKGGSYRNRDKELLITSRRSGDPASRRKYGGFRLCRTINNTAS